VVIKWWRWAQTLHSRLAIDLDMSSSLLATIPPEGHVTIPPFVADQGGLALSEMSKDVNK